MSRSKKPTQSLTEIMEEMLRSEKMLTADEVLDFLVEGKNFPSLPDLLKELMIEANIPRLERSHFSKNSSGVTFHSLKDMHSQLADAPPLPPLTYESPKGDFSCSLRTLLYQQEMECTCRKRKPAWDESDKTVRLWFDPPSQRNPQRPSLPITKREDALAICFALKLSCERANTFLNQAGLSPLNPRDGQDAIYMYTLNYEYPLSVAKKLLDAYEDAPEGPWPQEGAEGMAPLQEASEHTTQFLLKMLGREADLSSPETFLNTFLLPYKPLFTSYSKTALREYQRLKIFLGLSSAEFLVAHTSTYTDTLKTTLKKQISLQYKSHPLLFTASYKMARNRSSTVPAILKELRGDIKEALASSKSGSPELDEALSVYSAVIDKCLTNEKLFKPYFPSSYLSPGYSASYVKIEGEYYRVDDKMVEKIQTQHTDLKIIERSTRKKPQEGLLKNTVLSEFPDNKFYKSYEKHPENYLHKSFLRKAIILMFFIQYSGELIRSREDPEYVDSYEEAEGTDATFSSRQGEPGEGERALYPRGSYSLEDFLECLNSLLKRCQLGLLSLSNPFDFLVLYSIRNLEVEDQMGRSFSEEDEEFPFQEGYDKDKALDELQYADNPIFFFDQILAMSYRDEWLTDEILEEWEKTKSR